MSTAAVLAWAGTFVGAVLVLGGLAVCVEVWRVRRRGKRDAEEALRRVHQTRWLRETRCTVQALIDTEYALHGRSRLSERLVEEAMAEGVSA